MGLPQQKTDKPSYSGNSIMVRPNGPLICEGDNDITLLNADEQLILKEKAFTLCRCGHSKDKPFCDGSHKTKSEEIAQVFSDERVDNIDTIDGDLIITVKKNAMYSVKGPVTIFSRDGKSKTTRASVALCRCGHSKKKPFCDVQHKQCGFTAK